MVYLESIKNLYLQLILESSNFDKHNYHFFFELYLIL